MDYPTKTDLTWEGFFGGLRSHSHAPQEGHPLYLKFKQKAQEIFGQLSTDGILHLAYASEVSLGQME
jgi:hypothetical protein